jgi:predicted AlkP superfamily pyrophosphatase or phosphodiesterase
MLLLFIIAYDIIPHYFFNILFVLAKIITGDDFMLKNLYAVFFILYLFISSSSIIMNQNSIYGAETKSNLTGSKVCLVIVDSLKYESAIDMPHLMALANSKYGTIYKGICELPTNSRPGYERLLTGSNTAVNGIVHNMFIFPALTPDLFYIAKKQNLTTSASAFIWFKELFPLCIDHGYFYIKDSNALYYSKLFIEKYNPDLIVIHFLSTDSAAHKYGGNSLQYQKECIRADTSVKGIWDLVKNKGYFMIVTADHGHRDNGNHGDSSCSSMEIPVVFLSSKLNAYNINNNSKTVSQLDIAPTISTILGIPKTIYMTGSSLIGNNDDLKILRNSYLPDSSGNFQKLFIITSYITGIVIAIYTAVYISSYLLMLKLLKGK